LMHRLLFLFTPTSTPEIYTLSLHDALPICRPIGRYRGAVDDGGICVIFFAGEGVPFRGGVQTSGWPAGSRHRRRQGRNPGCILRSEEHTSELQSRENLVCRLLLEKKKK